MERTETYEVQSFAQTLKHLMSERGVTATVVSHATGIPTSTLSEWTAGRIPKLGKDVMKLARFFGVSVEFLITGEEPEQKIVGDLLEATGESFMTLHRGVYRVKVEKYVGPQKKRKEE